MTAHFVIPEEEHRIDKERKKNMNAYCKRMEIKAEANPGDIKLSM